MLWICNSARIGVLPRLSALGTLPLVLLAVIQELGQVEFLVVALVLGVVLVLVVVLLQ
jgi:hypothetical protein